MNALTISICLALATLSVSGLWCGAKLLKLANALLGWEWIILGVSATNAIVYFITSSPINFAGIIFLDAFSRTIGIPVIGAAGIFMLTRDWKIPAWIKIGMFVVGAVLAGIVVVDKSVEAQLPTMSNVLGVLFIIAQADFAYALFKHGLRGHGIGVVLGLAALQVTALLDGVIRAPTHPADFIGIISNFWVYSNIVWSIVFTEYYFAYRALLIRKQEDGALQPA